MAASAIALVLALTYKNKDAETKAKYKQYMLYLLIGGPLISIAISAIFGGTVGLLHMNFGNHSSNSSRTTFMQGFN